MTDYELKALWHEQEWEPPTPLSDSELVARMNSKMRQFHRDIFWRDIWELAACAFIVCGFSPDLFRSASLLTHVGSAIIVASSIFIAAMLVVAKHPLRRRHTPASVRDFIINEHRKVDRQCSLLKSILWWYILPLSIGGDLFVLGSQAGLEFKISFILIYGVVGAVIYVLNLLAVRIRLSPLRNELDQLLQTLPGSADIPNPTEEN